MREVEVHGSERVALRGPRTTGSCRRALLALPPSVACRLAHRPALPSWREQATRSFRGGTVITASLVYDSPHWRERGLCGYAANAAGPVRGVLDVSPPDAPCGVLQAFVVADAARTLGARPAEERRVTILNALAELFGEPARRPELYFEKDWSADPWTRGCYHGIAAPRAWTDHGPALHAPVGPLHWASSETATWGLGTMEGAVDAGRRAAQAIAATLMLS